MTDRWPAAARTGPPRTVTTRTGLALSVRQPWAWLLVHGHKPVENRTWSTTVRGWLALHASRRFDADGYAWVRATFPTLALPAPDAFPRGGLVGRVQLVDVVTAHSSPWFVGPFGFVIGGARPTRFRPCDGRLGLFRVAP